MEALIAVGLAGNIVQFSQFAKDLVSEVQAIRKTGSPRSLPQLRALTNGLNNQASTIRECLIAKASNATIAKEEKFLIDIATDCQGAGSEFLAYLDTLIQQSSSTSRLKSAGASIKFQFAHHKIEDYASKLNTFRNEFTLATVLALRTNTETNHEEVLERLRFLQDEQSTHSAALQDDMRLLADIVQTQPGHLALLTNTETHHRDVFERLQFLQHEQSTHSAALQDDMRLLADIVQTQSGHKLDVIDNRIQQCLAGLSSVQKDLSLDKQDAILNWLTYRQMTWRYEEIPEAYEETFRWILEKSKENDNWDDFTHYLQGDAANVYFISGKAGSGKSTLMKYVVDHPATRQYLSQWAAVDSSKLLTAQFFFWNAGTVLQKDVCGLLRALLHTILRRHPELISVGFPDIYQSWGTNINAPEDPSYMEVKKAWKLTVAKAASFLKLAIFIDGIDEFEGDHKDVSLFIRSLVSPRVKVIVSSRSINACLHAFHGCPSLRLQDLTMRDMETFVQGTLASHKTMVQLTRYHPDDAQEIITEIKEKACGVFLWVKLVVKLLVDGLEAGDSTQDLRTKLHALPSDLRVIYRRMISKMEPSHQTQAAEIFKLLQVWQTNLGDNLRPAILHFALHPPHRFFIKLERSAEHDEIIWHHQQIAARVRSRCCGLLEIHRSFSSGASSFNPVEKHWSEDFEVENFTKSRVSYLHRTVAEFLQSDDVSTEMQGMAPPDFDPFVALVAACLAAFYLSKPLRQPELFDSYIREIAGLYRAAPLQSQKKLNAHITTLDSVVKIFQEDLYEKQNTKAHNDGHWSEYLENSHCSQHYSRYYDSSRPKANIHNYAAFMGLQHYLEQCLPEQVSNEDTLIVSALRSWIRDSSIPIHSRIDTLVYLLQRLANHATFNFQHSSLDIVKSCLNDAYEVDVLLAIFATTIYRFDLITHSPFNSWDNVVSSLIENNDSGIRDLGYKLADTLQHMQRKVDFVHSLQCARLPTPKIAHLSQVFQRPQPLLTTSPREIANPRQYRKYQAPPNVAISNPYYHGPKTISDSSSRPANVRTQRFTGTSTPNSQLLSRHS